MIGLQELEKTTNASIISRGKPDRFESVCIDSRKVTPGSIFFAIKGERFDGHDFIADAVKNGAVAVVCQEEIKPISGVSILRVADSVRALGMLARFNRLKYSIPIIAVTGSVGKTMTKELIAKNLSGYGETVSTEENQNNQIGVPLTLLKIRQSTKYAVVELGSNHPGEISYLASLVRPTLSLIVSVGASHLEAFETIDNVIDEKLSILDKTAADGYLVIDGSDMLVVQKSFEKAGETGFDKRQIIKFDAGAVNKKRSDIPKQNLAAAQVVFSLILPNGTFKLISFDSHLRMEKYLLKGASVIVDCYNANPSSFRYAIERLLSEAAERRFIIMGDMAELGKNSIKYHIQIINMIKALPKCRLIAYGKITKSAIERCGISAPYFDNPEEAASYLFCKIKKGDQLLIKGSRMFRMEKIWHEMLKLSHGTQLELPVK
ncbi:MAG: hypothetical protein GXP60_04080 [Epsilonproteobacteria bacterium]|nr:hypothetical protein [Campylobacterota bacterium]